MLAKDLIKEPLLDEIAASGATQSRHLSTLSFKIQFAIARELYAAHASMLLEGNFRPGEHEPVLRQACPGLFERDGADFCQVLCRVAEPERLARLSRRQSDLARHAGHRDDVLAAAPPTVRGDTFLDLPGAQLVHEGTDDRKVLTALDDWWNSRTV
jgi:hypothetical protein